jgi:hypothetical protein
MPPTPVEYLHFIQPITSPQVENLRQLHATVHGPDMPSPHCPWVANAAGTKLYWDGTEVEALVPWLHWLLRDRFKQFRVVLTGQVRFQRTPELGIVTVDRSIVRVRYKNIRFGRKGPSL